MAVEGLARRPGHGQRRGGEQNQGRRAPPGNAVLRPTRKKGLRERRSRGEADIADDQHLKSAPQPRPPVSAGESQDRRRHDDGDQARIHPAEAHGLRPQGERGIGGPQPPHDAFGHSHARHRRAAPALDARLFRSGPGDGVPRSSIPRLEKVTVIAHVPDVFGCVLRRTEADANDVERGIEGDERISPAAITHHAVTDWRGAQDVTELMSLPVPDKQPGAIARVGAEFSRFRKDRAHFLDGDRRVALDAHAHVMRLHDPGNRDEHGEAVKLKESPAEQWGGLHWVGWAVLGNC